MIPLLLGLVTLGALMAALGLFSRASVTSLRQFGVWTVALGGLILAALLFLTGRGGIALGALTLLAPSIWGWMRTAPPGPASRPPPGARAPAGRGMGRQEALEVLGLPSGASRADIQAAYVRLMRAAHPDSGGSDWLAARINQARDALLG